VRLICVDEAAVAEKPAGTVGAVVSSRATVTDALVLADTLPAASLAHA